MADRWLYEVDGSPAYYQQGEFLYHARTHTAEYFQRERWFYAIGGSPAFFVQDNWLYTTSGIPIYYYS
jgi:hypothetical protein